MTKRWCHFFVETNGCRDSIRIPKPNEKHVPNVKGEVKKDEEKVAKWGKMMKWILRWPRKEQTDLNQCVKINLIVFRFFSTYKSMQHSGGRNCIIHNFFLGHARSHFVISQIFYTFLMNFFEPIDYYRLILQLVTDGWTIFVHSDNRIRPIQNTSLLLQNALLHNDHMLTDKII